MPPEILAMVLASLNRLQLAYGPSLANRSLSAIANFCINCGGKKRKLANLNIDWAVGKLPEPDSRLIYVAWIENDDIQKVKEMEKKRQSKEVMKKKNDDRTNTEHKEVDQSSNDDDDDDSDADADEQLKEKLIPIPTTPVPENFEGFQKIEIRYLSIYIINQC